MAFVTTYLSSKAEVKKRDRRQTIRVTSSLGLSLQPPPDAPQATKLVSDDAGWMRRVFIKEWHKLTGSFTFCGESVRSYDLPQFNQPRPDRSHFLAVHGGEANHLG